MIKSLRDSKAHLSEYVDRASQGEEIVITVRGKPKARLVPIQLPSEDEKQAWGSRLREARTASSTKRRSSSREILNDLREDRL